MTHTSPHSFWKRLSRLMSKVNPEPNIIHIMGCYILGNPNGEKVQGHPPPQTLSRACGQPNPANLSLVILPSFFSPQGTLCLSPVGGPAAPTLSPTLSLPHPELMALPCPSSSSRISGAS